MSQAVRLTSGTHTFTLQATSILHPPKSPREIRDNASVSALHCISRQEPSLLCSSWRHPETGHSEATHFRGFDR